MSGTTQRRRRAHPQFYAWTRQLTGKMAYRGYVGDSLTGRSPVGCQHYHRTARSAEGCAERLLRQHLRGIA